MARTKTVDRIKTLLSIPTGDLVEIAPDIWAVKPLWLDDIIAAYPAQSTYQAWIAKGYKATLVNLNTTGFKCYVVNRDGDSNAASLAMRMLEQERMPFSANGNGGSGTHLGHRVRVGASRRRHDSWWQRSLCGQHATQR
jgi:hypothetical protein